DVGDFKAEVIMQKTTYAFDLSIWEMFLWCIRGAKLFLLPKEDERDFQKIAEKIKKHNVTRLSFVPSVLEEFFLYRCE
ncbi:AMP-binding protein, partial [Bacillus thuringiensis]